MTPNYDFRCATCAKTEEMHFEIHDDMKPLCEECGTLMTKVFSATSVIFNGSGFYKTDNR